MNAVCVFCGSQSGANPLFAAAARELGAELARRGRTLVYGGGRVGLMGEVAMAVTAAGGRVVGVIPHALSAKEIVYAEADELVVVDTMHARKALMADRSDGFVALPGGYGTLDELFEILTWAQLGIHRKPVALLNVAGFFTPLLGWLDRVTADGLLKPKHRDLLIVAEPGVDVLDRMEAWRPASPETKWATPAER
jgi:uncharacterized protein (TIGR00730 family)